MKNVLKHEQTFAPNFRDVTQFFPLYYEVSKRFKNWNYVDWTHP